MTSPSANSDVNTTPIDAPSSTLPIVRIHSVSSAVSTPTTTAPTNIGQLLRLPLMKNAAASPGNTAGLIASPSILIRRKTRKWPSSAAATALNTPAATIQPSSVQFQ